MDNLQSKMWSGAQLIFSYPVILTILLGKCIECYMAELSLQGQISSLYANVNTLFCRDKNKLTWLACLFYNLQNSFL